MVKKAPQLNRIVTLYRDELAHLGIRVTAIFLYGSYAGDTRHEGSDIDLIVISPDFARFNLRERLDFWARLRQEYWNLSKLTA